MLVGTEISKDGKKVLVGTEISRDGKKVLVGTEISRDGKKVLVGTEISRRWGKRCWWGLRSLEVGEEGDYIMLNQ